MVTNEITETLLLQERTIKEPQILHGEGTAAAVVLGQWDGYPTLFLCVDFPHMMFPPAMVEGKKIIYDYRLANCLAFSPRDSNDLSALVPLYIACCAPLQHAVQLMHDDYLRYKTLLSYSSRKFSLDITGNGVSVTLPGTISSRPKRATKQVQRYLDRLQNISAAGINNRSYQQLAASLQTQAQEAGRRQLLERLLQEQPDLEVEQILALVDEQFPLAELAV